MSGIRSCILIICLVLQIEARILDYRVILKIRQSIEKTLNYIDNNYKQINEDCLFGVALSTGILMDGYRNGTHVMDGSSMEIVKKSIKILEKSIPYIKPEKKWVVEAILNWNFWKKPINYHSGKMKVVPDFDLLNKIRKNQNDRIFLTNMDHCLKNLANITHDLSPKKCLIDKKCWDIYYQDDKYLSGYLLTHKLLLLQLARARNCDLNKGEFYKKTREICSQVYSEVISGDYLDILDEIFDLFLEEIILCGYEGFTEFFTTKWLFYIIKSQKTSGCFPALLTDDLKSKIKRSTNIFEDRCADHTTGIALAVLSLYYNYINKEMFV